MRVSLVCLLLSIGFVAHGAVVEATLSSQSRLTKVDGNFLITTLIGRVKASSGDVALSKATSFAIEGGALGTCQLFSGTFTDINGKGEMEFTFIGKDDLSRNNPDPCLKRVLTMGDVGFTASFAGVPGADPLVLKVRPQKSLSN